MSEYAKDAKREYRQKALNNLNIPLALRPYEYEVVTFRSGDEVLSHAVLSMLEAITEPRHLLAGDVYDGGSSVAIDPFHLATPTLIALRFADSTGRPHAIHQAIRSAAVALEQHGVPPEIESAHAIGTRAEEFSAMDVVAVMPDLDHITTWRERAQAAHEMLGALVAVPADCSARAAVHEYTWALSNPGVPLPLMQPYVARVLRALSVWSAGHTKSGWGIHE